MKPQRVTSVKLELVSDRELILRWLNELDHVADHQSLADEYLEEIQRRGREYERRMSGRAGPSPG